MPAGPTAVRRRPEASADAYAAELAARGQARPRVRRGPARRGTGRARRLAVPGARRRSASRAGRRSACTVRPSRRRARLAHLRRHPWRRRGLGRRGRRGEGRGGRVARCAAPPWPHRPPPARSARSGRCGSSTSPRPRAWARRRPADAPPRPFPASGEITQPSLVARSTTTSRCSCPRTSRSSPQPPRGRRRPARHRRRRHPGQAAAPARAQSTARAASSRSARSAATARSGSRGPCRRAAA